MTKTAAGDGEAVAGTIGVRGLLYFDFRTLPAGYALVREHGNTERPNNPTMVYSWRIDLAGTLCQSCSNREGRVVTLAASTGCTKRKCSFNSVLDVTVQMPLVVPHANVVSSLSDVVNASDGDGYLSDNDADEGEEEVDFTSVILSEIWRVDYKGGQRLYRVQYDDKSKKDVVADRFDNNGNANDRQTVNDWRALCEENGKTSPWPRPENSKVIFPPIINARMLPSSFMSPYYMRFFLRRHFCFQNQHFRGDKVLQFNKKKRKRSTEGEIDDEEGEQEAAEQGSSRGSSQHSSQQDIYDSLVEALPPGHVFTSSKSAQLWERAYQQTVTQLQAGRTRTRHGNRT